MAISTLAPHPFPARMAPELALSAFDADNLDGPVLDPMCGSGTVLRAALQAGYSAVGFDVDPLAVLMASVWTSQIDADALQREAERIVQLALGRQRRRVLLPWIDKDPETASFIEYWFAPTQRHDLRLLAAVLHDYDGPLREALQLCLSRIIVTKDRGASLARDVSHSRPHRVAIESDYDVMRGFVRAAMQIGRRLGDSFAGSAVVMRGDARNLDGVSDGSIAKVVTSPPYLNAIDYLRGHRMALVWLGYRFGELREIRGTSIGAERGISGSGIEIKKLLEHIEIENLAVRMQRILARYATDLSLLMSEVFRVLQVGSDAVLIVGNSTVRGTFIDNAQIVVKAAEQAGLELAEKFERDLPAARRYLPPPQVGSTDSLSGRMRSEVILKFSKSAR